MRSIDASLDRTPGKCYAYFTDGDGNQRLHRRMGCMAHVTYMRQTRCYLRENGLDLADERLMTQGGYNFFQLTGGEEWLDTRNIMSGTGPLNIHTLQYDLFALGIGGGHTVCSRPCGWRT